MVLDRWIAKIFRRKPLQHRETARAALPASLRLQIPSLIGLCFYWLAGLLQAQIYQFRNYTAGEGLSDNFVFEIHQDRKGLLWFATSIGISRYDGVEFKNFTINDGLANNAVRHIYEDRKGRLWFSTAGGLSCLENGQFKNYTSQDGLPHDFVQHVVEDSKGNFWIGTRGGGISYFDGLRFTNYGEREGLKAKTVWSLLLDRQGILWIGSNEVGLHRYDGKEFQIFTTREGLPDEKIYGLRQGPDGKIWCGTGQGLCWFDGKRFHRVEVPGEKPVAASKMFQDHRGVLWFGLYGQGLGKLENGKVVTYRTQNGLAHDYVISVFEDREGNIWAGTQGGGVSKFVGERFANLTSAQGLSPGLIHAIAQDSKGNYWFGSLQSGLCRYDGKEFHYFRTGKGLLNDLVQDILIDPDDRVYVATDGGLSILESGRFRNYTVRDGLPNRILTVLRRDHQGRIWIGTFGGGAVRFDGKRFTRFSSQDGLINDRVHSLWEDHSRRLWFGTDEGVSVLENGVFRSYTRQDGLGPGKVSAIVEDVQGVLWFGTDSGLSRFDGQRFSRYSVADGLPDPVINFLQLDAEGGLWIGTNNGVSCFSPSTGSFRNYNSKDGLVSNQMLTGACLLDKDGNLWFGTRSGVSRCDPKNRSAPLAPPLVHLQAVRVFDQVISGDQLGKLLPEQNQVTFSFVGISFRDESRIRYRYFLEGFDPGWHPDTDLRFARYTNLPPGRKYRFRVRAANSDGMWSHETASVELQIQPFFYQKPLFQLVALLAVMGLISGVFKWRVLRIRRLNQELEANVRIRTSEVTAQKELLAKTNLELQILQNTSTAMSSTLDKEELGKLILDASMSLLNCPGGFLIDDVWANQSIHITQALGLASKLKGLQLPLDTISPEIIEGRESRVFLWEEIREAITNPVLRSMLIPCQIVMVPMICGERAVGILVLGRERSGPRFNEHSLSLLTTFANQAAVAIRNAELYQDIRASESKYRTLVEQAGDAIFVINQSGALDSVNPMATKLLGYTEDEYKQMRLFDLITPEHQQRWKEKFQMLVERGNLLESIDLLPKHGSPIPVEINTVNLGNGLYQAIVRDITVRKRLEEHLAKQRDRAEEATRLKSEFLASISHELRTPLHAILSYADFGLERSGHAERERLRRYFFEIKDSGALLLNLINDLLDLSKIEAGKMPYRRAPLAISVLIDDACSRIAQLAEAKTISLQAEAVPREWLVYGDYEMLLRVLINLLGNAVKFTPNGGYIRLFGEMQNGCYRFGVSDSGQGIYPEEIDIIFEKFVQSSLHEEKGTSGSGLGLSICRGIVEAHEGKIWAESAGPNQGSTFYFSLPCYQPEEVAKPVSSI
jgi:PAS domain S-box-containing protein